MLADVLSTLSAHPVIVLIVILALVAYSVLIELTLLTRPSADWYLQSILWNNSLYAMLSALPLLGLLGTIMGLLTSFHGMSLGANDHEALVSAGIAEAMLTTQVGLITVVPGWIMFSYLGRKQIHWSVLHTGTKV